MSTYTHGMTHQVALVSRLRGRAVVVGIAAAMALMLSACTPTEPAIETTAEPTPTVESTPSATPTPEAHADFDIDRFRSATLDLADPGAVGAALGGLAAEFDECPWYPILENHSEYSSTSAFFDTDFFGRTDLEPNVRFFYTISGDEVVPPGMPRNPEGVGVGSTHDEIRAAYPGAVESLEYAEGNGDLVTFTVRRADTDSVYVFASDSSHPGVINLLQWGPDAGGQWSHLCSGL